MKLARYSFYGPADPPAVPRILLSSSSRQVLMTLFMMIFGMRCVCSSSIPVKGEVALPKLNQASIVARSYVLPSAEVVRGWPVSDATAWRRHDVDTSNYWRRARS